MLKERPCFVSQDVLLKRVLPEIKRQKYNKKSKRKEFYEVPIRKLIKDKKNVNLNDREVPLTRSGVGEFTKTAFVIPLCRQYMLYTADNMKETSRLVARNMTLYKEFFRIFIDLKECVIPNNVEAQKILRDRYNKFKYERASTHMRGLPNIDNITEPVESSRYRSDDNADLEAELEDRLDTLDPNQIGEEMETLGLLGPKARDNDDIDDRFSLLKVDEVTAESQSQFNGSQADLPKNKIISKPN